MKESVRLCIQLVFLKECYLHEIFDLFCTLKSLSLFAPHPKALFERDFQLFFLYTFKSPLQASTHLKQNPQFLITTNCALSSRRANPRKSFGMH